MRLVTHSISQLQPYEAGKPPEELARELGVENAIKLASNENPLGSSPLALAAAQRALTGLHRYPDAAQHDLRHKLAAGLGVTPQEIALGAGSNELIDLIVRTFCTQEHHIVFAEPAFVVYRMAALAHGVPHTAVPLRDYRHDLPAMAAALRPNTRVVFVANPNNPTGTIVTQTELLQFLQQVPPEVIVVMDEAYIEYADAADFPDALRLRTQYPRLVCLRTFSKIYGLAALRLGYAVANAELVHYLDCVRAPFNVNGVAQAAGLAALDDRDHVRASQEQNQRERARLGAALKQRGIAVVPSQANFLLIDLAQPAQPIYQGLLKKGVIVRPLSALPSCLRVSVGLPAENDRFLSRHRAGARVTVIQRASLGSVVLGWLVLSLLVLALCNGCGGAGEEVIIKTAAGVEMKAADIDRDPYALLPEAPLVLVRTDAQAQFRSPFGQKLLQIVQSRVPLPQSAGFVPERDLESLLVGVYSMQGLDFAAVAVGRFDPAAILRAADGVTQTPLGAPLVKSEYAGRTLYTVGNIGFTLLTPRTALYGNETGMRRALDRIGRGQLQNRVPNWMETFLRSQNAPIAAALDLASRPEVAAAASSVALSRGLASATLVGNFEQPGMNFSGRLTYNQNAAAQEGAQAILALRRRIQSYSWLTALMGLGDPIHSMQVTPAGNTVDFQLALQGGVVTQLIEQLGGALGVPPLPVQATTTTSH